MWYNTYCTIRHLCGLFYNPKKSTRKHESTLCLFDFSSSVLWPFFSLFFFFLVCNSSTIPLYSIATKKRKRHFTFLSRPVMQNASSWLLYSTTSEHVLYSTYWFYFSVFHWFIPIILVQYVRTDWLIVLPTVNFNIVRVIKTAHSSLEHLLFCYGQT